MLQLNQIHKSSVFIVLLLFAFSVIAILPLFHNGFFQSDDGEWMIIRFSAFHQALADGQFPVRFLHRLNYGYGYPVANFLYPGFMYLGEILKLVGFGFVDIIKIILGITLIESAIFSYLWLRVFFEKLSAFIGALFYLYTPYHLFDVYKRGSVGETLSLATVPFILWQIERKSLFWTSLGIALLILAHNTLVLLFLPVIVIYGILRHSLFFILYSLFLGLGISVFFWIPALYDLQFTVFGKTKVSEWEQYFSDVRLIGFSTILIIIAGCIYVFKKKSVKKDFLYIFFLIIGVVSILFSTEVSSVFWKILPVSFIQFPFRFLSVTLLSVSFLTSFLLSQFTKKVNFVLASILVAILIISAKPFTTPSEYFDKEDMLYATNEATTTVQDEYMPKWVKIKPTEHFKNKVEIKTGNGEVKDVLYDGKHVGAKVFAKEDVVVAVNTIYFPGLNAYLNGKQVPIVYQNKQGIIEVSVPPGDHKLEVVFEETPVRLTSDIVSVWSVILLGVLCWSWRLRGRA